MGLIRDMLLRWSRRAWLLERAMCRSVARLFARALEGYNDRGNGACQPRKAVS